MSVHWFYIHVPILYQYNNLEDGVFFIYFRLFQTDITNFSTNKCEKMSIQYPAPGLNSQPSDYESPPLTTRPGLPPNDFTLLYSTWVEWVTLTYYYYSHLISDHT